MPKAPPARSYGPVSMAEPYPTMTVSSSSPNFSTMPLPPISTLPPPLSSLSGPTLPPILSLSSPPLRTSTTIPQPLQPPVQPPLPVPPTSISAILNPHPSSPRAQYPPFSAPIRGPNAIKQSSSSTPSSSSRSRTKNDPLPWLTIEVPKISARDGETYVPIYDDCNEIRRKIRAFFSNANTEYKCTQKHFLEVIGNVNSNSYRRFMAAKGDGGGAENGTYTGAYIFFEKKRIWEGKPKGKKRLDAELQFPMGRDLIDSNRPVYITTRVT